MYQAKYITKEVVFQQNDVALFGDMVHKSVEKTLREGAALVPDAEFMQQYVDWCRAKRAAGWRWAIEERLCITRNFERTTWFAKGDRAPWLRGIADVFFVDDINETNIIVDWKTGKPKHDKTQAHLLSLCAKHVTGYSKTICLWVHVLHDELIQETIDLTVLDPVQGLLQDVARYENACKADEFPAIRNGLCGKWCDVLSCPHNGKNTQG
jgi:hypothetical protein